MENIGTITRRLDRVMDGLQDEFAGMYSKRDFERVIDNLKKAVERSNYPSVEKTLFNMFDCCNIKYEENREILYYKKLAENAKLPESDSVFNDKILNALLNVYSKYPSPETYLLRTVDRLCDKNDGFEDCSLRLRILKQFIKYGNYLYDAGFGGKAAIVAYASEKAGQKLAAKDIESVLRYVDDGIFSLLDGATKEQKKFDGKYGILKSVDDLASGRFHAEGSTKKMLYMFAIVYGMTFYSGAEDEIIDDKSDIEVKLFREYYTNNLLRFFNDGEDGKECEFEQDPSGAGINYKNFAEIIYLYYLSKKDIPPQEKIKKSSEMIDKIVKSSYKTTERPAGEKGTVYYRNVIKYGNIYSEDILDKTEDELERFIVENYYCDTDAGSYRKGPMQLEQEQKTAFRVYKSIIQRIKDEAEEKDYIDTCNYGLWFTDVGTVEDIMIKPNMSDEEKANIKRFIKLLKKINGFIGYNSEEKEIISDRKEREELSTRKTKILNIDNPAAVTRTAVIAAYYYYFNMIHEDETAEQRCFKTMFNEFKTDVDKYLEEAYYQPLSGKNFFDIVIVFSAFSNVV